MITSRHNAVVQEVRRLARQRPPDRFILEGPILLGEALRAGIRIELMLTSPRAEEIGTVVEQARARCGNVVEVSEEILEYVADSRQPQALLAVGVVPCPVWPAGASDGTWVALDEVRDPGNLGTIVRTARAAAAAGVVLIGDCVDPWSPKVVRASAGALFSLPVHRVPRPEGLLWLAQRRAVAAVARAERSCLDSDLRPPLVLLFGSESHGVGDDLQQVCVDSLHIPMAEGSESLNLGASVATLLYLSMAQSAGWKQGGGGPLG
jgi:RNA methyltransferase, TrmH family